MANNKAPKVDSIVVTLPDDLIFEHILSRLPVNPLGRFKCVSKNWLFSLSTHQFAKTQLNFSKKSLEASGLTTPSLILQRLCNETQSYGYYLSFNQNFNVNEFVNIEDKYPIFIDSQTHTRTTSIINICNGLVCMHNRSLCFFLWNPAINQFRNIPGPEINYERDTQKIMCLGFNYISSIDDYRLVCVLRSSKRVCYAYVFSLSTGDWTELGTIDVNSIHLPMYNGDHSEFIEDTVYWTPEVKLYFGEPVKKYMFGLNVITGKVKMIPLFELTSCTYDFAKLFPMKGSLSLCCVEHFKEDGCYIRCEVWWLNQHDGSSTLWEKMFSFGTTGYQLLYMFDTKKCLVEGIDEMTDTEESLLLYDLKHIPETLDDDDEESDEEIVGESDDEEAYVLSDDDEGTVVMWRRAKGEKFFKGFVGNAWGYAESLISPFGPTNGNASV